MKHKINNENQLYIGRNCGRDLLDDIQQAKQSIDVVSPFLSKEKMVHLLNAQQNKVNVRLLMLIEPGHNRLTTSAILSTFIYAKQHINRNKEKLRQLMLRISSSLLILVLLAFIIKLMIFMNSKFRHPHSTPHKALLFFHYHWLYSLTLLGLILIIVGALRYFKQLPIFFYSYHEKLPVRLFDNHATKKKVNNATPMLHAKLFIIDERVAYYGSLNLTNAGCKRNIELLQKTTDKVLIQSLKRDIEHLYTTEDYRKIELIEARNHINNITIEKCTHCLKSETNCCLQQDKHQSYTTKP